MNIKYLIMALILISPILAYTQTSFSVTSSINKFEDGGFIMQVSNSTPTETLGNLTVFATILDPDGLPIKQVCAFESDDSCYLWTTDQSGTVHGTFHIDDRFVIGENYTLKVSIEDWTNSTTFSVVTYRDMSRSVDITVWLVDNAIYLIGALILLALIIFIIGLVVLR